ncbi:MAG: rhodanese-like domain-containing protein [bacterium]
MQTTPTIPSGEIEPRDAQAALARGECVLGDVREADEHARERIAGSVLLPLSALTPKQVTALGANRVAIHCKSGRRGADAVARCAGLADAGITVVNVRGGIEAWKTAGLPTIVDTGRPRLSVMQQTQIVIGTCVFTGTALGFFVHPGFLAIPAFMGAGLVFAGSTGFCGMAVMLGKLPWNRVPSASCRA